MSKYYHHHYYSLSIMPRLTARQQRCDRLLKAYLTLWKVQKRRVHRRIQLQRRNLRHVGLVLPVQSPSPSASSLSSSSSGLGSDSSSEGEQSESDDSLTGDGSEGEKSDDSSLPLDGSDSSDDL